MNLSPSELACINNKEFLLTKMRTLKKLQKIFSQLYQQLKHMEVQNHEEMNNLLINSSGETIADAGKQPTAPFEKEQQLSAYFKTSGKISRGENYRQLPYLVLDYPRKFTRDDIFAFRTLFWWGHFFSNTLHLQGNSLLTYRFNFLNHYRKLSEDNFYICINSNPWEYHYNKDNYVLVKELKESEYEEIVRNCEFLKLSRKLELNQIDQLYSFTLSSLTKLKKMLTNSGTF